MAVTRQAGPCARVWYSGCGTISGGCDKVWQGLPGVELRCGIRDKYNVTIVLCTVLDTVRAASKVDLLHRCYKQG